MSDSFARCYSLAGLAALATAGIASAVHGGSPVFDAALSPGHPPALELPMLGGGLPGDPPHVYDPDAPPDSPLATGPFVNFEAPVTKAMALDGANLFVCRTPNNSLAVIDTAGPRMVVTDEIWVGLDPVSVALQPGTHNLWVCAYTSDSVVVVDTAARRVVDSIKVGDRPVNMVFSRNGRWAYVVCEGSPAVPDTSAGAPPAAAIAQEGALVAIDTAVPRHVVKSKWLDMHTPRAIAIDGATGRLFVAALHSGNNTTSVGRTVFHNLRNVPPTIPSNPFDFRESWPTLVVPFLMPSLQAAWGSPLLTPWPDATINNLAGAELVERIVTDAGTIADALHPWRQIVDLLSDANGSPEPAMVAEYQAAFESAWQAVHGAPITLVNAEAVLAAVIDDAKDTVDHDVAVIDGTNPAADSGLQVINRISNAGATITGMAYDAPSDTLLLTNLEPNNVTRLENHLVGRLFDHQTVRITDPSAASPAILKADLHAGVPGFTGAAAPNPAAQAASLANPADVVFRRDGQRAYIAALGSGRVASILPDGTVLGRRDVGGLHSAPRSLLAHPTADVLYAFDRTNMTVTKLDTSSDTLPVLDVLCLSNPEPIQIRTGRRFLYSARFSNNFASSCAVCHVDGHLDHRAWDLGDSTMTTYLHKPRVLVDVGDPCVQNPLGENHPIKGPMVTQSLRGLKGRAPFHWRGDKERFQDFNGAFVGLLGAPQPLADADMDRFAEFVESIVYPPTYYRDRANEFKDPRAELGRSLFLDNCQACHHLEFDGAFHAPCADSDVAFNFLGPNLFSQIVEIPQLRGLVEKFQTDRYAGFGLLHDGREERESNDHPMKTFVREFFAGLVPFADDLIAFLGAFQSNVMPCVGDQFLWTDSADEPSNATLTELIRQHDLAPSRCDVVLSGVVAGARRGFVLIVGGDHPRFQSDLDEVFTLDQIRALIDAGADLLVAAVPPGSGRRIGIDWDRDCKSNGVDPLPLIPAGDADGDYRAGLSDIAAIITHWGLAGGAKLEEGDVTGDCAVDLADIAEVINNWGWDCSGPHVPPAAPLPI